MSTEQTFIFYGNSGKYYFVNDIAYDAHFPIIWAMNHTINTETQQCGPEKCEYCYVYGRINNVFVGYCAYCLHAYRGMRGAVYHARPEPEDVVPLDTLSSIQLADRCAYMVSVPIAEIGNDEREMAVEKLMYYGPTQKEIDTFYGLDMSNYGYDEDKAQDFYNVDPREDGNYVEKCRVNEYIYDDMYDMLAYRAASMRIS